MKHMKQNKSKFKNSIIKKISSRQFFTPRQKSNSTDINFSSNFNQTLNMTCDLQQDKPVEFAKIMKNRN